MERTSDALERPYSIRRMRAAARVLLWLGGLLAGVAVVEGAVLPMGIAFVASMAAIYAMRACD